ncbi:Type II inositol 1,4,5-trisphosphate 5-phosphatase [Rhodosporidiobolus nylandii]
MAAPLRPTPATYGLATQLRTPPSDANGSSPALSDSSTTRAPKKATPAMRDDIRTSPRPFAMPQWGAKESPRGGTDSGLFQGSPHSLSSSAVTGGMDEQTWREVWGDEAGARGYPVTGGAQKSVHSRTLSATASRPPQRCGSPARPPRPDSPSRATKAAPLPPPVPRPTELTASGAPIFNKVDFSFQPLDLGIKMVDPSFSTYKANLPASKSTPNVTSAAAAQADEDAGTPYAAQVRVSVAQRVERAPSFRKGSLADLGLDGGRRGSQATTRSSMSSLHDRSESGLTAPQPRPPRPPSPGGTARPIGQGLRSSYAGSTASCSAGAPPVVFRRASSVYIPHSSTHAASAATPTPAASGTVVPTPGQTPQAALVPGSKLPLNLLTLARRTAHISETPGYAWRLNLLEKLELIMGSFLTVADAEAILSIGNGPQNVKATRANHRKSQISMPTSSFPDSPKQGSKLHRSKSAEPKTFFGRMKRALSNPGVHVPKETPPPLPTAKKTVFGTPLAHVAEYGFVTSMIAGQRHDLPGVCFSTVEEIYRRSKVPGLMQLHGEPGRIAKLVQIYDTPPDYGEHHDLSIESIHNVTSLLKRYLRDLPEPVLDQRLWRLYIAACIDSKNPLKSRIACAQIILRLLPTPNFSLLVYLVAFLSQMPLFPENRLTLVAVSGMFGSSIMAPRPKMEQSKPGKGEMVITGPTESFEAIGETIKKGQEALLWLLKHWCAVADGLLEPEFDIDPSTVVEKHNEAAPTLNVEVPQPTLHIQQPKHQSVPVPPFSVSQPPQHERPGREMDVQGEHRGWALQSRPLSPQMEQSTLEISSIEQFNDVRPTYDSPAPSPVLNGTLRPSRSPLLAQRASSPASSRSHRSPLLRHLQDEQQPSNPRATSASTPKSPSSVYDVEDEEQGPPTPRKEIQQPFFSHHRTASQQQALPSIPHSCAQVGTYEEVELDESGGDEEQGQRDVPGPPVTAGTASESSFDNSELPQLQSSSEASSDRSASVVTPRDCHAIPVVEGNRKSLTGGGENYRISGYDQSVLDGILDYEDNASVYAFPSPPVNIPVSTGRPSPFLPPSPFLTQDEVAAALAAEQQQAPAYLSTLADRHIKAAPVLEEKLFAPKALPAMGHDSRPHQEEDIQRLQEQQREEEQEGDVVKAPIPVEKAAVAPASSGLESALLNSTASSYAGYGDEGVRQQREERADVPPRDVVEEDASDLPSARPPVPLKHHSYQPRSLAPVNLADFESKRHSLPASDAPGSTPSALLRSKDDQLLDAQKAAESSRKEVQSLWKQLTDLELERTHERSEMAELRREVEGFKERMTKRLSQQLNEQENKKLDEAVARAKRAEEEQREKDDDARRTREELELLKLEAAHTREEAAKAHEEVGAVKSELKVVEELRRKEQADARATIEALEAQLSSIRAVLLGGAGLKV